jgi:hypothetical protein
VLLLAPWPESLWAFRRIWSRVSGVGRVVAIDLPGFGHSDGRPELIAPDTSGAFLAHLIQEWGWALPTSSARHRHSRGARPCREGARTCHQLDRRRRRGPLPDRRGRYPPADHRGAESGGGTRAGCQDQHRLRGPVRCRERPRAPSARRRSLRVGASSQGLRPPGPRLGQRRLSPRRNGLTPAPRLPGTPARWLVFFARGRGRGWVRFRGESHRCDSRPRSGR